MSSSSATAPVNPPSHEVGDVSDGTTTDGTPTNPNSKLPSSYPTGTWGKYDYDEHLYPRGGKKTLENLLIPTQTTLVNSHPANASAHEVRTHPFDTY